MISLLHSEPQTRMVPAQPEEMIHESPAAHIEAESPEFEIVMGRRQVASVSLVMIVLLSVFSGVSYLIGKSSAAAPSQIAQVQEAPGPPAEPVASPQPQAQPQAQPQFAKPTVLPAADGDAGGGPLFADPVAGAVYIQVGAVEKGVAEIWAEGLRTHGLKAFVAPGLSDRIFRVLVGPLPSPDAYQAVKDTLDRIGLAQFGRKYQL
jgi:cell division septation protein DedD